MNGAIDLCYSRLTVEEGRRPYAYNDATGKRVSCQPQGNLSIGVGINLETGLDNDEIDWLSKHRLEKIENQLSGYQWYRGLDPARQSVLLDIAFNQGTGGLLHYPHMLAAIQGQDWKTAAMECHVADPRLDKRYSDLAKILLSGET